jgi:hypothetical protein
MIIQRVNYSFLSVILSLCLVFNIQKAVADVSVSVATNMSTYISGDTHAMSIGIQNTESTEVIVDVYLAKMLTDGSLQFVQYNLSNNTATLAIPTSVENQDSWSAAVTNLSLPPGMDLQNFSVLSQIISDLDSLGQYRWYIALATPGTKSFISNIGETTYNIDTIANILTGNWSGTWTDTVFNVSGTADISVQRNDNILNATGNISLQSIFLPDAAGTATATITDSIGNNLTFPFGAELLGSGSGSFTGRNISGSGSIIPSIGFGDFTFNGTVLNEKTIQGTFQFTNAGSGAGTVTMSKSN